MRERTEQNQAAYDHPSRDRTWRFEVDQLLRRHGFAVHSRRTGCPAVWRRGGEVYTQTQALGEIDSWAEVRRAEQKQESYYEEYPK